MCDELLRVERLRANLGHLIVAVGLFPAERVSSVRRNPPTDDGPATKEQFIQQIQSVVDRESREFLKIVNVKRHFKER